VSEMGLKRRSSDAPPPGGRQQSTNLLPLEPRGDIRKEDGN